ncbi:uncharacterized protein LOC133202049 [Saccostrea echinata]|uniref:uncharacterized protein LOC133202049 n=1 Tax=Saccostrea echinata TaxID=191078 RepID=UPI002A82603A|nr:uncharacterized protein LOC133202049 [Saccostrea echinata]
MMYRLVLQKSVTVTGVSRVWHITRVSSDRVWISDYNNLILTNTAGDKLHHLTDIGSYYGVHTVNNDGELIYIDREYNINKLSTENTVKTTLIKYNTAPWRPLSVYSSPSTGDLLVGMYNADTYREGKVVRYNSTGEHIQTIQYNNNTGQRLYSRPSYITENRNGDVIVSDWDRGAVVVTDRGGSHHFSYTGPPSGSRLWPRGICTDALSHILVCGDNTESVQILDREGNFLSQIQTSPHGIDRPGGLSYDDTTHLLWVGSWYNNTVNIYRVIDGDSLTGLPLQNMKCKKHPRYPVSQFCIPCEVTLCEECIMTSDDHRRHDVRDVEKLFHDIHKIKDGDAVLMCLLLCPSYKINLNEEQWIMKYNATADILDLKKIEESSLTNLQEYTPVLKQDGSEVTFSCEFFKHTSFLRFVRDPTYMDIFLNLAEKENIAEYCRSWAYPKEEEEVFCWISPQQTDKLIEKLGEGIFTHPTWLDTSIHASVFSYVGIPVQIILRGDDSVQNFIKNLKKGKTVMYHASGMIIGCAGSGKSTLLGRLKGIDLEEILKNTTSTRGIEVQTDVFDVSDTITTNLSNQKQRFKVKIDETSQHDNVSESCEIKALDTNDSGDDKNPLSETVYEEEMIHDYVNIKTVFIKNRAASKEGFDEYMVHDYVNIETLFVKKVGATETGFEKVFKRKKDVASLKEAWGEVKENQGAAAFPEKAEENLKENQNVAENLDSLGILRVSRNISEDIEKRITMVDFAGQCAYYASHQIFLSPRAFFILVLNMEKRFDDKVGEEVCSQEGSIFRGWTHRDYLTFWIKSVHQYGHDKAPVLLVATHAEKKTEKEKTEFFREIWKTLKEKSLLRHLDSKRKFAVGFHESECIEKIKLSIVNVVQKLDHWGEKLPHSWAMFENFFQEKKHLKIINKVVLLAFNEALPQEIKLERDEDINIMLMFFHDIKELLHFDQEFLNEIIILDVQWFADAFKNVITDKNHAEEDLFEYAPEWDKFDETGELSDSLLSAIWNINKNGYLEHKDKIMLYMEKLGLLAKMGGQPQKWYVPCMNKIPFPVSSFTEYPASSILCYVFDVLPAGIFHRLVATCMQIPWKIFSEADQGCIYQTAAVFMFQDHNILLGMTESEIQLQVFVIEGEVDVPTCHQIRKRIDDTLKLLSNTFQTECDLKIAFKCKAIGFCDSRKSAVVDESKFTEPKFLCPHCSASKKHNIISKEITKYWKQEPQRESVTEEENIRHDPSVELILNVVSRKLRGISSSILAANFGVNMEETSAVCVEEDRFRILYKWKCKNSAVDHRKELENILREVGQGEAADYVGTFQLSDFECSEIVESRQPVSEREFRMLSEKLSKEYTHLVRFLGLPQICIEQIEVNVPDIQQRIFKSLSKLKEERPYLSRGDIGRALKFIERIDVIDCLVTLWEFQ